MPTVPNYIELKRNFVAVAENVEPDPAIGWLWGNYGGWLNWPEVLDHARVVLLAEAQSGKTEEFKHATAGLREGGRSAFYATIEQLADGRFNLSPGERILFDTWRAGSDRAWFFLDSVDEARLNRKKFDDALRNLVAEVRTELGRASVLVSCRVSDWKGKSDRQTIFDILPISKPAPAAAHASTDDSDAALLDPIFKREEPEQARRKEEKKKPDLLVVQLVPLTDEQRRIFAQANGIRHVDAFMDAIERQGLDVLAERPGDMLELVQYWISHKQFGTLTAMTEATVSTKLNGPDKCRPDNSDLPLAKAREGAERLAAAMTLAKTFTVIAPGQEPDPTLVAGALDPDALLTDWATTESNALLRRGIFAPSTYGRIRFHHRSTQEYLTACWLKRLLDKGCQCSEIFGLIFTERYGVETVAPSLRSAAAWLALHFPDIRDEIIRREPHRARGRYHASPKSPKATCPTFWVSAIGAAAEVAVEVKHGGKNWSTAQLEGSLRHQLAEDYLRPATRRHGIFVVTNHKKRSWTHPATRKRLNFAEMIAYLNGVAVAFKRNSAGDIAVTVIGIDAVKKARRREHRNRKKLRFASSRRDAYRRPDRLAAARRFAGPRRPRPYRLLEHQQSAPHRGKRYPRSHRRPDPHPSRL